MVKDLEFKFSRGHSSINYNRDDPIHNKIESIVSKSTDGRIKSVEYWSI